MRTFGESLSGCEQAIEDHFKAVIQARKGAIVHYCQIGIGDGKTFKAMTDILAENACARCSWHSLGFELPEVAQRDVLKEVMKPYHPIIAEPSEKPFHPDIGSREAIIYLCPAARFLNEYWEGPIDFAMIEVTKDLKPLSENFKAVEARTYFGSVVCFHGVDLEDSRVVPLPFYEKSWKLLGWLHGKKHCLLLKRP